MSYTSTSNIRNAIGRLWEIHHYTFTATDPITDIYTESGPVGPFSSYFGSVPDYDFGFVVLAADGSGQAPDLNAYADIALMIAGRANIGDAAADLNSRMYATNLEATIAGSETKKQAFRGVAQDRSALADARKPTCISWTTVDQLRYIRLTLDGFVFSLGSEGRTVAVSIPVLDVSMARG
ncbi:hypothetical protein LTR53_015530 [Teratosphaeriaceae sp. CCFEE 6253]|nr:hypothetical protein LTR53_015530 [Teratosphaeriaceae sp. CCFEE 6253]